MTSGGQTINDRILAARHSIAGQGLAKAVCKATTEELIGPKRKHLDCLLRCTEEPNVSIPSLANLLLERIQNPNWIVVFKSLVTIHHLMCYGNERFTQYLASSNTNFQLSNFLDKGGVQGYDMSPFVRRYAKYLSEKSVSYRNVAFDFCKVKRGKDGGTIRQMNVEKLLKTLPVLHEQLDALLEFEATTQDLNNGVINAAFMLLFRDLIRLFACYNGGVMNLLEKYFDMNKKNARDALDIYKKFLIRMDRVAEFLKVAEKFGIDKTDIPDLARAPSSLLGALEAHLANLEGRKVGSAATTPTVPGGSGPAAAQEPRVNVENAVLILSSTSTSFGATAANSSQIDEKLQKQLLDEEEQAMIKYKEQAKATNPFFKEDNGVGGGDGGGGGGQETPNILDLFGMPEGGVQQPEPGKSSDDLLQLSGNPFASVMSSGAAAAAPPQQPQANFNFEAGFPDTTNANGLSSYSMSSRAFSHHAVQNNTSSFGSDNSFINVFGAPPPINLQLQQQQQQQIPGAVGASFFGDILQPQVGGGGGHFEVRSSGPSDGPKGKQLVSGDLDASLANLTSNLNLSSGANKPLGALPTRPRGPPMAAASGSNARENGFF